MPDPTQTQPEPAQPGQTPDQAPETKVDTKTQEDAAKERANSPGYD